MASSSTAAQQDQIAIVGAGLAGLTFALALQSHSIPCTVYEARPRNSGSERAMMASPKSLSILDKMKIYSRIENRRFRFERVEMKPDGSHEAIANRGFGSEELFGHKDLRVYRQVVTDELLRLCEERGVHIVWEKPFRNIISENEIMVEVGFNDGTVVKASTVVRTDISHSKVWGPIVSGARSMNMGQTSVVAPVERMNTASQSEEYHLPVSLAGKNDVLVLVPQDVGASEPTSGTQIVIPDSNQEETEEYRAIDSSLVKKFDLLNHVNEGASEIVKSAVDNLMLRDFILGHSMSSGS